MSVSVSVMSVIYTFSIPAKHIIFAKGFLGYGAMLSGSGVIAKTCNKNNR